MQRKNIVLSTVTLTLLMSASVGLAMNGKNSSGQSPVLNDVVAGLVVGSVAKLAGNTAFKEGDFSMSASLATAAGVGAFATGAAYSYDKDTNLLAVIVIAVATYCGLTKTFFPHKKKPSIIILEPKLSTHSHSDNSEKRLHRDLSVPSLLEGTKYSYNR